MSDSLSFSEVVQALPHVRSEQKAREKIRAMNQASGTGLVVLDDDPTGCQTVHDTKILLSWESDLLARKLAKKKCFYILTNSRAYSGEKAHRINQEVAGLLDGTPGLKVISRSDSTLRGHFYEEVSALAEVLGPFDGLLVVPFFLEGGRLTLNDIHYVRQDDTLVPAHQSEFARDRIFGYRSAHLAHWVEERSGGRWKAGEVISISLEDIRRGGSEAVCQKLLTAEAMRPIIVNAMAYEDLEVMVLGLCRAEAAGKRFLYRTAASFVKIRAGMDDTPLVEPGPQGGRGLVVVGSYVQKTTEQLSHLLGHDAVVPVEVVIEKILSNESESYQTQILYKTTQALSAGRPVVLFTQRQYAKASQPKAQLAAGKKVSDFLSGVVWSLDVRPDFVIAKGGITSHDIAAQGFRAREATVRGQIAVGVPYWTLDDGKCPGLPYVVFPGNVGEPDTLQKVFTQLWKKKEYDH